MRIAFAFFFILLFSLPALSQDFEYGKFDNAEMDMTRYDKDTSAHAVVLREFGKSWISSLDRIPLIHEYHVKIKIFDSKKFNEGDVAIRLYLGDNDVFETVRDIKGITYYKDDNGNVQKAELDSKKIYHEKVDKHHELVKFALPNLRNGCVIEYSYITESPYHFNFHSWVFQSDIPKIYSEYEAHIPAIYEYNTVLRGYQKLTKNTAELERECFSYYGTKADCSKIIYAMSDVPAFVEEDYMTSRWNYISAIYYELSAMTNQNGIKEKKTQEWKDVDYSLKHNDSFGSQIKRKDVLKDRIPAAIWAITDTLDKAKAIYAYLQTQFKWNNQRGIFSEDGIKKALDNHSANVADINLSLVAALNAAGITAEAVVLSTRENGLLNKLFPVESDFDYVVAKADIGNTSYLLDATDPLLPFGLLPLRCINDQGRVMSLNKPSYWIDMVQSQKKTITTTLNLALQADGKIKGTITTYSMGYAAYEKRKAIKKFNTVDEYVESITEKLNKLKLQKWEITGVDILNLPIVEKYEVTLNNITGINADNITFNPAFWIRETINPFKLNERNYPVDMGSAFTHSLLLTLSFPDNFTIAGQPAPVGIALPNKGGKFITDFSVDGNVANYSQIEQLSKAIYQPEEYPYLKELYNKIIQNQKANIVFKKKS
jgi:transglutaminase-like putative cysteine protease